jgi:hypothetical protein
MAKEKPTEITVIHIFDGTKSDRQAFIELILSKSRGENNHSGIDFIPPIWYNKDVVYSDVHVG